jgi:hypothetical protein
MRGDERACTSSSRAASCTEGAGQVHNKGENGAADARGALWYKQSNAP